MNKTSLSDHQERMNRVLRHIEQHMSEELRLDAVAQVACYSPFHFHRIFQAHVGETLHAHVRRLRLERAAHHLRHTTHNITRIALDAGYETPSSFATAFSRHFECSPSTFRKEKRGSLPRQRPLPQQPRKENLEMTPEIRNRDEVRVVYVRRRGKYQQSAAEAWEALCAFAGPRGLLTPDAEYIGISHDDPTVTPEEKLRFDACITVQREMQPEGDVAMQTIPGGRYAVFMHEGPYDQLSHTYGHIYGTWLPESGTRLRDQACFEKYLNDCTTTPPEELRTEIYVPVQ